jgi:hypothetical protein
MDQGTENSHEALDYGFVEMPGVEGHRRFILGSLMDRYGASRDNDAYVLILHRNDCEHYIMGIYDDLREALQTRFVSNSILIGAQQFKQGNHMGVHHISGPSIENRVFDPKTNSITEIGQKPTEE